MKKVIGAAIFSTPFIALLWFSCAAIGLHATLVGLAFIGALVLPIGWGLYLMSDEETV